MSRRIDIELTSRKEDGSWTWRAPGARQPRGNVPASVLPSHARVGDVLRAEAEFDLDGITVVSTSPTRAERDDRGTERIEVLGPGRTSEGVSVELAPGRRHSRESRQGRATQLERGNGRGPDRADAARPRSAARRDASRAPGDRTPRASTPARGDDDGTRRAGGAAPPGERPVRRPRDDRPARRERPRRLQVATANRNAALAELRPEQLPVAEQLLRGGIPAVRQAIEEQNARARAEDRAQVSAEPLIAMAEELLPKMNLASWKDRAVAARAAGRDAPLREMRSVVSGSSAVMLDDEGRELLAALRETLDTRAAAMRHSWLERIEEALGANRVAEALRVSARPPEPSARVPADLAVRLAEAAGGALNSQRSEPQWLELLDAVVGSPVRRTVRPVGLPPGAGEELLGAARRAAGLVPGLAKLLGLPIPPPPGPRRASAGRRS